MAEINGTPGNDHLIGTFEDDVIRGLEGTDRLDGELGNDIVDGGPGSDEITGGDGADDLSGGDGDDFLFGRGENDTVDGGGGNDIVDGGGEADIVIGGPGDDLLFGGGENDTFVLRPGDGADTIQDFERGADVIDVSALGIAFADLDTNADGVLNDADANVSFFDTGALVAIEGQGVMDAPFTEIDLSSFVGPADGPGILTVVGVTDFVPADFLFGPAVA